MPAQFFPFLLEVREIHITSEKVEALSSRFPVGGLYQRMKRTLLTLALVLVFAPTGCQIDSTSTTTETTEQALAGDFCNAKFPALYAWDGKPPPQIASGRFVLLRSQYTGWWLLSLVDLNTSTIPYAVFVSDQQLNQMTVNIIRAGIVGPGGNPPQPPCEIGGACSKYVVALAQNFENAVFTSYEDAKSCTNKTGTVSQ